MVATHAFDCPRVLTVPAIIKMTTYNLEWRWNANEIFLTLYCQRMKFKYYMNSHTFMKLVSIIYFLSGP